MKTLIKSHHWLSAIGLAAAVCLLTSCSSSSTVDEPAQQQQQEGDVAEESEEQTEISEDELVGRWVLDPERTEELTRDQINAAKVGGQQALNQYIRSITGSKMDFDLHADGSFDCYQSIAGTTEEYSGDWLLDGNNIRLKQTHHGDVRESDLLTGTVDSQSMSLLHRQQQLTVPYALQKQSE